MGEDQSPAESVDPDLFNLQPVAPDPLQQVAQAGDQGVLLHTGDADLAVTQLHGLPAHLLHQHALGLHGIRHILTQGDKLATVCLCRGLIHLNTQSCFGFPLNHPQ